MSTLSFFATSAGRWTRAGAGVALIAGGAALGGPWWSLAAIGAGLVAVGTLDVCLLAPLAGKPFKGREFRATVAR